MHFNHHHFLIRPCEQYSELDLLLRLPSCGPEAASILFMQHTTGSILRDKDIRTLRRVHLMNFAYPKVKKGSSSALLEMGRQPCCDKSGLKRGPWTMEEDQKLINFIINNGIHCWRLVPKLAGLMRCGKSCRLRWTNYLRPDLKRGAISEEEENQMIQLHSRFGNRWSKIASYFSGRTDNEIKNHWNTRIKKRFKLLGVDPVTHKLVDQLPEKIHTHQEANFSPQTSASQAKNTDASAMAINLQQQSETEQFSLIWMSNSNNTREISNPSSGNNCTSSLCNPYHSPSSSSLESVLAAVSDLPCFPAWEATYPLEDLFLYGDLP